MARTGPITNALPERSQVRDALVGSLALWAWAESHEVFPLRPGCNRTALVRWAAVASISVGVCWDEPGPHLTAIPLRFIAAAGELCR